MKNIENSPIIRRNKGSNPDVLASSLADIVQDIKNYNSYVLNVGQSNEDWGPAFQQAINYVNGLGGGTILVPVGTYQVITPINILSGITIKGNSRNIASGLGSRIMVGGTNNNAFLIGQQVHDVIFSNFVIDGNGLSNNNIGILCQGAYPYSSYRITFEELTFNGLNKGVSINATDASYNWQFDNLMFNHCQFQNSTYGIYGNAFNFDYTKILNCWFNCLYGIYIVRCGRLNIDTCSAAYQTDLVNSVFMYFVDVAGSVLIQSSQAEQIGKFLVVDSGGAGNTAVHTLIGNIANADININSNIPIVSIGNRYDGNFVFQNHGTDCVVTSNNDQFTSGHNWSIIGNTQVHVTGFAENDYKHEYRSNLNPLGYPINVSDQQLTTTSTTQLINVKPYPQANYMIMVYYRVETACTLTISVQWSDSKRAITQYIVNGAASVGSYTATPIFVNASPYAQTQSIIIQGTASVANAVYVSASVMKV